MKLRYPAKTVNVRDFYRSIRIRVCLELFALYRQSVRKPPLITNACFRSAEVGQWFYKHVRIVTTEWNGIPKD
jgi:hypothetical protein